MQIVTINKNQAGQRLDKFLKKYLPEAGSSFLYKMLRKKNITLNGKKAEGKEMLEVGDEVKFFFSDETFEKFSGLSLLGHASRNAANVAKEANISADRQEKVSVEALLAYKKLRGISVLYEDENIVIVNKPVGILTQKAAPNDLSLNEWLIGYLLKKEAITEQELHTFKPSVCNRLDRNTSGIILCGKSLAGSQALSKVIKERTIRKFYHTICCGMLTNDTTLEGYLQKDNVANKVSIANIRMEQKINSQNVHNNEPVSENIEQNAEECAVTKGMETKIKDPADYIKTAYHPLARTSHYTLLEVELITGKTHQIRAHLSGTGHSLIGDYKYGNVKVNNRLKQEYGLEAQLLHAHHIIFPQNAEGVLAPLSGKTIEAPCPKLFQVIQHGLKLDYKD